MPRRRRPPCGQRDHRRAVSPGRRLLPSDSRRTACLQGPPCRGRPPARPGPARSGPNRCAHTPVSQWSLATRAKDRARVPRGEGGTPSLLSHRAGAGLSHGTGAEGRAGPVTTWTPPACRGASSTFRASPGCTCTGHPHGTCEKASRPALARHTRPGSRCHGASPGLSPAAAEALRWGQTLDAGRRTPSARGRAARGETGHRPTARRDRPRRQPCRKDVDPGFWVPFVSGGLPEPSVHSGCCPLHAKKMQAAGTAFCVDRRCTAPPAGACGTRLAALPRPGQPGTLPGKPEGSGPEQKGSGGPLDSDDPDVTGTKSTGTFPKEKIFI